MNLIDLHTHSTASDGTDEPALLVRKAADMGLAALALTDHDTVDGLDEAEEAAAGTGLEFIRGCEISTSLGDQREIHMLGLWLPRKSEAIDRLMQKLTESRNLRNRKMLERMLQAGLKISMDEVEAKARGSVGKPHFAAVLVEKGYAPNTDAAFAEWLGHKGKAYVPKITPTPAEAARFLRTVGATPILAHPLLKKRPAGWLEELVRNLKASGLGALEAWHSRHSTQNEAEIIKLAARHDLGLSGGSDYHGSNKPQINLATGMGNLHISADVLEKLKARRKAEGLPC